MVKRHNLWSFLHRAVHSTSTLNYRIAIILFILLNDFQVIAPTRQILLPLLLLLLVPLVAGIIAVIYCRRKKKEQHRIIESKLDPFLVKTFQTHEAEKFQKGISGLAIADTDLFITTFHRKVIEFYDLKELNLKGRWTLKPVENPFDLVYCSNNDCLYVMDLSYRDTPKQIIRVDRNGNILRIWTTGMIYGCLSVSYDCNVLMAEDLGDQITEYAPDGQIVRKIDLSTIAGFSHPRYAIKMTNDRYLISHGQGEDPLHRVCVVDSIGNIQTSFGGLRGSTSDRLILPIFLAIDPEGSIFVVDCDNSRVLLLNSDLQLKREIIPRNKDGMQRPERMAFDHVNGRLLLVHNDIYWRDSRVFVFKIL